MEEGLFVTNRISRLTHKEKKRLTLARPACDARKFNRRLISNIKACILSSFVCGGKSLHASSTDRCTASGCYDQGTARGQEQPRGKPRFLLLGIRRRSRLVDLNLIKSHHVRNERGRSANAFNAVSIMQ